MIEIIAIALALSMDAFAVSMSAGTALKTPKFSQAILVGTYFGFFQFFMPILGWFGGMSFRDLIENFDHWIAFSLLGAIGGKMIWEALMGNEENKESFSLKHKTLFVLAIATSIDALGVGLSFAFLEKPILLSSILIGVITFLVSCFGVFLGKIWGHVLESKAEIFGGVVLIGIGVKILLEHLLNF